MAVWNIGCCRQALLRNGLGPVSPAPGHCVPVLRSLIFSSKTDRCMDEGGCFSAGLLGGTWFTGRNLLGSLAVVIRSGQGMLALRSGRGVLIGGLGRGNVKHCQVLLSVAASEVEVVSFVRIARICWYHCDPVVDTAAIHRQLHGITPKRTQYTPVIKCTKSKKNRVT